MRALLVLAGLVLAGCQTPCPAPVSEATTIVYRCEDGSDINVTFRRENATVVQEGYTTLVLPARIAGSGYRYSDNGAELRGRMNETRWTRPGAAETICDARQ